MASRTLKLFGKAIFRLRGWGFEPLPEYWEPKQVIIGFPHTSLLDTFMAFGGFAIVEQKGHVIVKKEAFFWPLGPALKALGGVPIERGAKSGLVEQLVREFRARESFQLALVPEGTRKGATRLKTGFWHIAKAAEVPLVLWYLDNEGKRTRWLGRLIPGDDLEADLAEIGRRYAAAGHHIAGIPTQG